MVRFMVVMGLLSFMISGCSSDEQSAATPSEQKYDKLRGSSVDISHAVASVPMKPAEIYGTASNARIKLYLYADMAVTREQRAQTAMKAALDTVKGGAYDALVWLYSGKSKESATFVAVANYEPFSEHKDPWNVMSAGADGDRLPYYER